ncbi:hypothetical protein [Alterisphingorhabdus coralli]|uniref:Uncharacterized protein n=1 Tax=Alterisphingorhabdus coralli TaxID=3071408 RepID=A0AA97I138_9SPHN|nr:hypothetical protein [Parasphingorhabdus sp. SCSIO 66989]WOE74973.1 hypothetical protein RB602_14220 [Parasphingorhabdus sp. SCSIO 66989]
MSYDLLVFDPNTAPRKRDEFMKWYESLTRWEEQRDYDSPQGMTGNLPLFFERMRQEFPPMNGPFAYAFDQAEDPNTTSSTSLWKKLFGLKAKPAPEPFNEALVTDYSLAESAIYMAFAWSVSDKAYNRVFNNALSAGVGFFDVSADNGVILHDPGQFEDLMGL